jgi:hypothetical protein
MTHVMNGKEVTTNELISEVFASVIEDVDKHFDEYAKIYIKDYNEFNEGDFDAIAKWKPKIVSKLNTKLNKRGMVK